MNIKELVEFMKQDKDINLETMLKPRTYIPVAEKKEIIEDIINKTTVIENGYLKDDGVQRKIYFDVLMAKYHTNLDIDDIEEDYDALHEGLVDGINLQDFLMSFYRKDYEECKDMLNITLNDMYKQCSIEASVGNVAVAITNVINTLTEKIQGFKIEDILSQGIDADQLKILLEKYGK